MNRTKIQVSSPRSSALLLCAASVALLSGCGPVKPPEGAAEATRIATDPVAAQAAADAAAGPGLTADPSAMLQKLNELYSQQALAWSTPNEVVVEKVDEPAAVEGQPVVKLTPTSARLRHFVGFEVPKTEGAAAYDVRLWVKGGDETQIVLELAGREARPDGRPKDYGTDYVDLTSNLVLEGFVPDDARIAKLTVATEDGWKVVSFRFSTRDGYFTLNIGLAAGGSNTFRGESKYAVTLGGIQVTKTK